MTEPDFFIDTPSEPQIHVPKVSLISKEPQTPRTQTNRYRDISILTKLGQAKFPVYLVECPSEAKNYAMKVFPILDKENGDGKMHPYMQNEARFAFLDHPNVIKTVHVEQRKEFVYQGNHKIVSFILSEYASRGDLLTFMTQNKKIINERLVRTYFRQLIEGLEYIHRQSAVHLDIKLENLLLDDDFTLKIADFDLSAFTKDSTTLTKGTKFYRAPELFDNTYKAKASADIYAAGITLFILRCGGVLPHSEKHDYQGLNLYNMINECNADFWKAHCEIQKKDSSFFSTEFKDLFNSMVRVNPEERATIQEIKRSKWYNGPVYSDEELKLYLQRFCGF